MRALARWSLLPRALSVFLASAPTGLAAELKSAEGGILLNALRKSLVTLQTLV